MLWSALSYYHTPILVQRKQLMVYKAKDADRLNDQNEKFRSEREMKLKQELQQATKEPPTLTKTKPDSRSSRKGSASGMTGGSVEEGVGEPSICPTTPLEFMVCWSLSPLSSSPAMSSSQDVHDNEVSALCFNSQGNYMATGGADKVVKVWCWRESLGRCSALPVTAS